MCAHTNKVKSEGTLSPEALGALADPFALVIFRFFFDQTEPSIDLMYLILRNCSLC